MRIKTVSCSQFAGVRDRHVSFTDGINIVYGKNESGKSTLVHLISRTLFQRARLDRRSDKEFFELYFPSARKGSVVSGDFADGRITFETERGTYTLSKEWGTDPRCTLSTPDGVIRDQATIDAIVKDALLYGEGVYSDLLFSSQSNAALSLQTILDASKKTDAKQELVNAVSRAFAESDGISVDAIEQAIYAKIDEIAGKHWDMEREAPVRKAGRWSNGLGEILKAYYALEDANAVLAEISCLESEADRAANEYTEKDAAACAAEEAYNAFHTFASRLTVQSERKKAIGRIEKELQKLTEILESWPKLAADLESAKALQNEKTYRELIDTFEAVGKIIDECRTIDMEVAARACPTDEEIRLVKTAQRTVAMLENKLCGMNLNAAVHMLGNDVIQVTSLRTGEAIDVVGGLASITEAVMITIPDVMELQLYPADVDVASVETQIGEQNACIAEVFGKYEVESLEALETLARSIADAKIKAGNAKSRLAILLGNTTFEELEAAVAAIPIAVRSKEEIEAAIMMTCGGHDIARFVTAKETVAEGYTAEYGSINDLKARIYDLEAERKKARESVSSVGNIPAEYASIIDPDAHLEALQHDLKDKQRQREAALTAKTSAASRLEAYKETLSGDPADEAEKAARIFAQTSSLLGHWMHIAEVFKTQKETLNDNPMQDIADRFTYYLGVISDGRISSEFPEADKLSMNIYSDNKLLDYGKLSEGTKETVSLAFRLAVLDYLFPEGGGVIVLDDPFTDMDAERTARSCALLAACAKRHQVVFLTCKEEYTEQLGGHVIRI